MNQSCTNIFCKIFILTSGVLRFVAEPYAVRTATFLAVRNAIFDISWHLFFTEFSY